MRDSSGDPYHQSLCAKVFIATCLIFILFVSMIDSSGVDGVVPLIQANFNINDSQTAIIRTLSSITHTTVLGLVWLFGDSFDRRKLFLTSVTFWLCFSLLAILLGSKTYWIFVAFRTLGAGAASVFSVLVQVMLADLFRGKALGIAIMCMSACEILSGSFIGIVSSIILSNNLPWQSALVAAPLLAIIPLLTVVCTTKSFRSFERLDKKKNVKGIFSSAFGIFSNKSLLLLTASISLGSFNLKAFMFWLPSMFYNAWTMYPEIFLGLPYTAVTTLSIMLNMAGTLLGLPFMFWLAQSWYHGVGVFSGRAYNRALPIMLSTGSVLFSCMYFISLMLMVKNYIICQVALLLMGFGMAGVSLGQQILLLIVPSSSRAAAVALTRLVSGLVSTPSAQIAGAISDAIKGDSTEPLDRFNAYQIALLIIALVSVSGSICDIILVFVFPGDVEKARQKEERQEIVDETTTLIEKPEERTESILETAMRSRATTTNSLL